MLNEEEFVAHNFTLTEQTRKNQPTCMWSTYEKRKGNRNRNPFTYGRGLKYKITFGSAFENEIIQYLQDSRFQLLLVGWE